MRILNRWKVYRDREKEIGELQFLKLYRDKRVGECPFDHEEEDLNAWK